MQKKRVTAGCSADRALRLFPRSRRGSAIAERSMQLHRVSEQVNLVDSAADTLGARSLDTMFSEYVTEYREMAEQCLAFAASAWHVEAKTAWLELAQKWQRLAGRADKYSAEEPRRKRSRKVRSALLN
jgi:hypothetical protein